MNTYTHDLLSPFSVAHTCVFRNGLLGLDKLSEGSFLDKTDFPFLSSPQLPVSLHLGWGLTRFAPLLLVCPLALLVYKACLGSHIAEVSRGHIPVEYRKHRHKNRCSGPLYPFLRCTLSLRCRGSVVDVWAGQWTVRYSQFWPAEDFCDSVSPLQKEDS